MIFDNSKITSFSNLSFKQKYELKEEFITGNCWILAITLNIMYGYPISANLDELGYLEHVWVRLPNGKALDIDGIRTEGGPWLNPLYSNMDTNTFLNTWRDEQPKDSGLTDCDLVNIERCKKLVLEFLLPTYKFLDQHV